MGAKKKVSRRYAVCIRNEGNEASLERNKLYVVLPDRRAGANGLVRVIDQDGGDYLYPAGWLAHFSRLPDRVVGKSDGAARRGVESLHESRQGATDPADSRAA